jgi:hypothetical protein
MDAATQREYRRLRNLGWKPDDALRAAKITVAFRDAEADGLVEFEVVPDEYLGIEDLEGDVFKAELHPEIPRSQIERERKEFHDRIEHDGVWGIVSKVNGKTIDSVWGFVGDDWKDSGYDTDVKAAALDIIEPTPAHWMAL